MRTSAIAIASNIGLLAQDRASLEPAVIAFLATASGMSLFGLGAAFWGVVFGMLAHALMCTSPASATKA